MRGFPVGKPVPERKPLRTPESLSVARAVALLLGIALQSAGSGITLQGARRYHGPPSPKLVGKGREAVSFYTRS